MANEQEYEVVFGRHARVEGGKRIRYVKGQTFVPTDVEIKALGVKLRLCAGASAPAQKPSVDVEETNAETEEVPVEVEETDKAEKRKRSVKP